jgi:hypothetical protein
MAFSCTSTALAVRTQLALVFLFLLANRAPATLIVHPPQPITHRVEVQIIQTSLDGGLLPATVMGNASQQAAIETGIDKIWAQAGIDIEFLPTITTYANTFAYQGAIVPRPTGDLGAILSNATASGKINSDPNVLNMFFVKITPGYNALNQNTSAGIAMIGNNGMAIYNGASLLTFANGRDVIAGVMAHEIGHNLGLTHTTSGSANMMAPSGTSEQMTADQIAIALNSRFVQSVGLVGDLNGDGIVNSADVARWRNAYGANANGDVDGDGDSDGRDLMLLQRNLSTGALTALETVPEPGSGLLMTLAGIVFSLMNLRHTCRV